MLYAFNYLPKKKFIIQKYVIDKNTHGEKYSGTLKYYINAL